MSALKLEFIDGRFVFRVQDVRRLEDLPTITAKADSSINTAAEAALYAQRDGAWTPDAKPRHHPAGIEPPELYEQWKAKEREIARARERDLIAACPDVKAYTQACRYMDAAPAKAQPEPFKAEGEAIARSIGR